MALAEESTLSNVPTYQAAAVVIFFAGISILVERGIGRLGSYFKKNKMRHLYNALERIKEELMLLGFISILLTLFSSQIAKICVPFSKTNPMLFCKYNPPESSSHSSTSESLTDESSSSPTHHSETPSEAPTASIGRKLIEGFSRQAFNTPSLSYPHHLTRRLMSSEASTCKEGYDSFVSAEGLHQLHNLIFFMAIFQVIYAGLTMFLAIIRIHSWKKWEEDAKKLSKECSCKHDVKARFDNIYILRKNSTIRLTIPFTLGVSKSKKETAMSGIEEKNETFFQKTLNRFVAFLKCSVEQYYSSISKREYFILRMAFITNHNTRLDFDFHSYIMKCTESDFVHIVGVSWYVWVCVVILLLLDVSGWHVFFWVSLIPAITSFIIGAKLKHIMKIVSQELDGIPKICVDKDLKLDDAHFWFDKPKLILVALHYMLFQNAFEMSTFVWFLIEFGGSSCFIDRLPFLLFRLLLSIFVQFACGFFTLPLYAIATQMGSHYKSAIFSDHMSMKLTRWAEMGKEKSKQKANANSGIFTKLKNKMKHDHSSESLNAGNSESVSTVNGGLKTPGAGTQNPKSERNLEKDDHDAVERDIEALDKKYNIDNEDGDDDFDVDDDESGMEREIDPKTDNETSSSDPPSFFRTSSKGKEDIQHGR